MIILSSMICPAIPISLQTLPPSFMIPVFLKRSAAYRWMEAPPSQLLKPWHLIPVALETITFTFQKIYPTMDAMYSAILMASKPSWTFLSLPRHGRKNSWHSVVMNKMHGMWWVITKPILLPWDCPLRMAAAIWLVQTNIGCLYLELKGRGCRGLSDLRGMGLFFVLLACRSVVWQ